MPHLLLRLALLALLLALGPSALLIGCNGSSHGGGASIPLPPLVNGIQQNPLDGYAAVSAPVTSSAPNGCTLWIRAELVDHVPHPSARVTRSVLRPGEWNTPRQRLEEEVALVLPEADSRIPPTTRGAPAGWQVCAITPRITLSVKTITTTDQHGNVVQAVVIDQEADGLTDPTQRALWCRATDDVTTAEGTPLMATLAHELRHAHVYELELARTGDHARAARESKAVDPSACAAASCGASTNPAPSP